MPVMAVQSKQGQPGESQTLLDVLSAADQSINNNTGVQSVQSAVNTSYLDKLSFADDPLSATLGLGTKGSFDQILERLELYLNSPQGHVERTSRGLGYNNLLFMAAELLLLQSHPEHVRFS
jgi:putative ATP-dependent endonuclease of OLD family